jgi:alkyl hydroperoxide reductase subunit AhpC
MKFVTTLAAAALLASAGAASAVTVGQPAPQFKATDVSGKAVSLADFKGKYVVLEWNNPNCPFVIKHYASGNMQALQKRFGADNVAWIVVNSTNDMHGDYYAPDKLAAWFKQQNAAPTAVVMDPTGDIGRAFGAKVTPHMFVVDPKGSVIYAGAIDDKRTANAADAKGANNYVAAALTDARSGKPVATATSSAYGCSIKYQ